MATQSLATEAGECKAIGLFEDLAEELSECAQLIDLLIAYITGCSGTDCEQHLFGALNVLTRRLKEMSEKCDVTALRRGVDNA